MICAISFCSQNIPCTDILAYEFADYWTAWLIFIWRKPWLTSIFKNPNASKHRPDLRQQSEYDENRSFQRSGYGDLPHITQ